MGGIVSFIRRHVFGAVFMVVGVLMNAAGYIGTVWQVINTPQQPVFWQGCGALLFFVGVMVILFRWDQQQQRHLTSVAGAAPAMTPERNAPSRTASEIEPDWPIRYFFEHLLRQLGAPSTPEAHQRAARLFHDQASDGKLLVWARAPARNSATFRVSERSWGAATLTFAFMSEPPDGESGHAYLSDSNGTGFLFDLRVNRAQALKIWPEAGEANLGDWDGKEFIFRAPIVVFTGRAVAKDGEKKVRVKIPNVPGGALIRCSTEIEPPNRYWKATFGHQWLGGTVRSIRISEQSEIDIVLRPERPDASTVLVRGLVHSWTRDKDNE